MSEENKNTTAENKILSFHIAHTDIENPEMDRFMLESLAREADELEARLNADPALDGVEAPEGLFASIVDELKARGIWEEDEAEEAEEGIESDLAAVGGGAAVTEARAAGADEYREGLTTEPEKGTAEAGTVPERMTAGAETVPEKAATGADTASERMAAGADTAPEKAALEADIVPEQTAAGVDTASENTETAGASTEKETTAADSAVRTPDAVYDMLSEEDKRALELGRSLEKRQQVKTERKKRLRKGMKAAGIVAAVLVLVFGVSMTSEANRRLVTRMWDGMLVDFGFKVNTNYAGADETIRSKSKEELEALEDIRKKLGGEIIELGYLPSGMRYIDYDIRTDIKEALLMYSYEEKFFYVTILNMNKESANYYTYDTDAVFKESVTSYFGIEAKIWEINLEEDRETYITEIEYEGWRYVLNGMVPLEELEKIVKGIVIF